MDGSTSVRELAKGFPGQAGELLEWTRTNPDEWCWATQIRRLSQFVMHSRAPRHQRRVVNTIVLAANNALATTAPPFLEWSDSEGAFHLRLRPRSLIGALWLQAVLAVSEKKLFKPCRVCDHPIEISRTGGARTDAVFCSNKCKSRDYRQRRDKALRLARRKRTRRPDRAETRHGHRDGAPVAESGKGIAMLYRRGQVWWYKFRFAGRVFRESTKTESKTLARQAERKRHQALEEAIHGIKKRVAPITLATCSRGMAEAKEADPCCKVVRR